MKVNPLALTIRAKKLGALMRSVREAAGKSIADCAGMLGVTPEAFEGYELGEQSPSLPELEVLAYQLNVPLEYFFGDEGRSPRDARLEAKNLERLLLLRHKIIGAQLRKARMDAGLSLEALAEAAWSSPSRLEAYEMGEIPIPLPDLETLSGVLNTSFQDFRDKQGPVAGWARQQRLVENFLQLPADLQDFIDKPVNQPYLELALRLSEMDVNRLRGVAEGLLEITL